MNWYGTATFFDSCPQSGKGGGACGICFSNEAGIAYPYVTGHLPDCAKSCTVPHGFELPELACGAYVSIQNLCSTGGYIEFPIVDHGPGAACTLDMLPCDWNSDKNPQAGYRLLDLTPVTFQDLGGKVGAGYIWTTFQT